MLTLLQASHHPASMNSCLCSSSTSLASLELEGFSFTDLHGHQEGASQMLGGGCRKNNEEFLSGKAAALLAEAGNLSVSEKQNLLREHIFQPSDISKGHSD